jgi:hypothetical protein
LGLAICPILRVVMNNRIPLNENLLIIFSAFGTTRSAQSY